MEIIKKENTTEKAIERIQRKTLLFQNKENRDKAYKLCKEKGIKTKKGNSGGSQLIHPEYIEDYEGMIEVGFGNSMYKTYFKKLYTLEEMI